MKFKILLFLILLTTFCFGQKARDTISSVTVELAPEPMNEVDDMLQVDSILKIKPITSSTIYPKEIPTDFKAKYKGKDFDYTTVKPHESIMERMMRNLKKVLESIFGEMDPIKAGNATELILKSIAIFVVGFVLYLLIRYLMGKEGNLFFGKKNKKVAIQSGDLHENIHEISFEESIANFERSKDYRLAIRYQFLRILKKLSDKKMIEWNPEKTNRDYVKELKDEQVKKAYQDYFYIFDNVWYGEFEVNETEYQSFKKRFEDFKI